MEEGLGPGHIVLDGDPALLKKEAQSPSVFGPCHCSQTAGWITMPLRSLYGDRPPSLGSGDIVLDRDSCSSPPKKWEQHPPTLYGPCLLWPNVWMDQDAISMEIGLAQAIVLDGDPAFPPKKMDTASSPNFRPMAKRLNGSRCHLVQR